MSRLNKYNSGGVKSAFSFIIRFLPVIVVLTACTSNDKRQKSAANFVITSPEVYEIVCAIGGSSMISGRTRECTFPDLQKKPEIVGSFSTINVESVIRLNPEYVFTSGLEQEKLNSDFNKLGIKTRSFYPKSVEGLYTVVTELGELTGLRTEADSLNDYIKTNLQQRNLEIKPRVYIEIYGDPVMSASDESFLGELITTAGGDNIFETLPRDYSMINTEDVILANPDIILLTYETDKETVLNRKGWQDISAIRSRKVYTVEDIDPDLILRAGPRIVEGVRKMEEIFGEYEIDTK